MKKTLSLVLCIIFMLSLASCSSSKTNNGDSEKNAVPYGFVPIEHTIYHENGEVAYKRTIEFKNGFMSKIVETYSGFRRDNTSMVYNFENNFNSSDMILTQNIKIEYTDNQEKKVNSFKQKWYFGDRSTIKGVTSYSQGEDYDEAPEDYNANGLSWLNSDGSMKYALSNDEYPVPTMQKASFSVNENDETFDKIKLVYDMDKYKDNAHVIKTIEALETKYGKTLSELNSLDVFVDINEEIAYHTLWNAIAKEQSDGSYVTEIKYENGTVGERIVWKNVSAETFISFFLLDWDWFGRGTLDSTVFSYGKN